MTERNEQNETANAEETARDRIAELERLVMETEEAVSRAQARITELEQLLTDRENEINDLKQASLESEQRLTEASSTLSQAVASYKARLIEANPEVPAELIAGDTIEAVDSSLESARSLVSKVRQGLESEIKLARIPAGAPQRAPIDFSALSPREKIQHGIGSLPS